MKDEWAREREELGETSDHQIDSKPGERREGTGRKNLKWEHSLEGVLDSW